MARQQFTVDARQRLARLDNFVGISNDFLGWKSTRDHHGQQGPGHAVANRVGDEQANMMLIQASHIVDVATDIVHGAPQSGDCATRKILQFFRQKIALNLASQMQLIAHLADFAKQTIGLNFRSAVGLSKRVNFRLTRK